MAKGETIHGWTVEEDMDGDNPVLRLTKEGRPFLLCIGEVGIDPAVHREYATTRVLEVEAAAGTEHAADLLDHQVRVSRANQMTREMERYAASLAGSDE